MKNCLKLTILALLPLLMTACQSLPQTSQTSAQGYESPIPVHVGVLTGVRL